MEIKMSSLESFNRTESSFVEQIDICTHSTPINLANTSGAMETQMENERVVITNDELRDDNEQNMLDFNEPAYSLLRYFQYSRGDPLGICRICQKQIRRTQGNTNGMNKHLMLHPSVFNEFFAAKSAKPIKIPNTDDKKETKPRVRTSSKRNRSSIDFFSPLNHTVADPENIKDDFVNVDDSNNDFYEPSQIDESIIDLCEPPDSLLRYYEYKRGEPSAKCRICHKQISRKKGNTKGTTRHLMLHSGYFKEFATAKNLDIPLRKPKHEVHDSSQHATTPRNAAKVMKFSKVKVEKWEPTIPKSKKIDEAVLRFICLSSQPLSLTEQDGFAEMFSLACPSYSIKSQDYMTALMNRKFQSRYSSLKDALRKCQSCSFTTAVSQYEGQCFLGVTCHYIDEYFNRCWRVLGADQIHCEQQQDISKAMSNKISEIFVDFDITHKQVHLFVRDFTSSMSHAVEDLKFQHFDCFLRAMASAVNDGSNLPEISKQIRICRDLVAFYNWSTAFQNALARQQQLVDAPKNPLIGENPTQWVSTLAMLRRVVEQRNALLASYIEFNDLPLPNFELLKKILNILQPFETKTKMLSGRKECISSVLPTYKYLLNCLEENSCDSMEERVFKRAIFDGLRNRMQAHVDKRFLVLATLLDARYKNQANIFDQNQRARNRTLLCSAILPDLNEEQRQNLCKLAYDRNDPVSEFLTGFNEVDCMAASGTSEGRYSAIEEEVDAYLESTIERIGADPLDFWKRSINDKTFPNLRKLSRIFLSAPPSSTESERAVTKLVENENFVGRTNQSIDGQKAKALMFLHFNFDN